MTTTRKHRTETVHVLWIERNGCTANGNPRYKLFTKEGTFLVQSDSSISYSLPNDEAALTADGALTTLVCTPAGRVYDYKINA